jgi:hypothetical protein
LFFERRKGNGKSLNFLSVHFAPNERKEVSEMERENIFLDYFAGREKQNLYMGKKLRNTSTIIRARARTGMRSFAMHHFFANLNSKKFSCTIDATLIS